MKSGSPQSAEFVATSVPTALSKLVSPAATIREDTTSSPADGQKFDMSSLQSIDCVSDDGSTCAIDDDESASSSSASESSDATEAIGQLNRSRGSNNYNTSHEDSIINVITRGKKPDFSLDDIKNNPMTSMLQDFLAKMADSNEQLEIDKASGKIKSDGFEIKEVDDENNETVENDGEGQYIEMSLGLGVLEEKHDTSSSDESSNSTSGEHRVMDNLVDVQGDHSKGPAKGKKKLIIEEV